MLTGTGPTSRGRPFVVPESYPVGGKPFIFRGKKSAYYEGHPKIAGSLHKVHPD